MVSEVMELRANERFRAREPLPGSFGAVSITVVDVAETGAQVEHPQPLRLATRGRLVIRRGSDMFTATGIVVWSHLSKRPNDKGKLLYRSGIRFEDEAADFTRMIEKLLANGAIEADPDSLERKKEKLAGRHGDRSGRMHVIRTVPQPDLNVDQVLLVQHARDRLRAHPDEALKWYNRAKYAITQMDEPIASELAHRDEVLAVWEYLERTVDLATIARVFDMKKQG